MKFATFIRWFGFLKNIPPLPWIADGLMQLYSFVFRPQIIRAIDQIEKELSSWPGINITYHKYGGIQFNYGKKELGHIHGNGLADIHFSRKMRDKLISGGLAAEHHFLKRSGWVSYWIKDISDSRKVTTLFRRVYEWRAGLVE